VVNAICNALSLDELESALCEIKTMPKHDHPDGKKPEGTGVVYDIRHYIQNNYVEHITMQELSNKFGYVPGYISILFKEEFEMSPADYLVRLRIDKAKEILSKQQNISIKEVAELVGFKNQHHFSRIFKKLEGMWPSSFKS
jgi:YesN/AraC family two-component response regulator